MARERYFRSDFLKLLSLLPALAACATDPQRPEVERALGIKFPAIVGFVYDDLSNKDGLMNPREDGISGQDILLVRNKDELNGEIIAKTTTNQFGMFYFDDLAPGNYGISPWFGATMQGLKVKIIIQPSTTLEFGGLIGLNDLPDFPSPDLNEQQIPNSKEA